MMMAAFAPDSALDTISDFGALVVTLAAVAGIVWTAVVRAMKPLRERLDAIQDLTRSMAQERERVDDLSDKGRPRSTAASASSSGAWRTCTTYWCRLSTPPVT